MWNEIKNILADENPENTIGSSNYSYRKVTDGIMFVLRTWMSMENVNQMSMVSGSN